MAKNKVVIQGYPGSYHDVACNAYFNLHGNQIIPADSFNILGDLLSNNVNIDYGVMAIENSIAGTILQNYRILREHQLSVIGEIYLRIQHFLMCLPGQTMADIKEVHSHPMAINQCRAFLNQYPDIKLVDTEDTALSAKHIEDNRLTGVAAIASQRAASLYNLAVLQKGIEDNKQNYTRFFIIQKSKSQQREGTKASIWVRVAHEKGSLLKVLQCINDHDINMSKLQSFPVLGKLKEYFFHMDLEFDQVSQYYACIKDIQKLSLELNEFGIYKKADISAALREEDIMVML